MNSNENITLSLDQICTRITDGSHYSPKDIGYGYPMLSVKDMTDFGFDYSSCKRISKNEYTKLLETDCVPQINDVLVAKDGSFMKHVFVTKEFKEEAILSSIAIIRPNTKIINPFYLKYYFLNPSMIKTIKENYVSGSAVPRIVLKDFKKIPISFPKIDKQKAIVNILLSLDDKIELNNKINKILEELAQTLYKRWFVDFEFPNEDGEPYKSSGGEMVESELGLIPKGWSVDFLGEVVNISYGKNLPTKSLLLKGYPVFGGNGIIGYTDKFLYKNPKVLVSCRGAASGSVLNSLKNSFVTNNSLILEDNEKISYEYLKELSKNRSYFDFVSGSAQPQVTIASISQCKIIIPQRKTLNEFSKVMKDSNEIIENLYYENLKLAQLRDELLPKLMNGEIEVPIKE